MPVDADARKNIRALVQMIAMLRERFPQMNITQLFAFLIVALHEGSSGVELTKSAGEKMKRSSMSRLLIELSVGSGMSKNDVSGLVSRDRDSGDLRSNSYSLTPQGLHLLTEMMEVFKRK